MKMSEEEFKKHLEETHLPKVLEVMGIYRSMFEEDTNDEMVAFFDHLVSSELGRYTVGCLVGIGIATAMEDIRLQLIEQILPPSQAPQPFDGRQN